MAKFRPALERFEEKYIPEPNSGCWLWTAALNYDGYGWFGAKYGLVMTAHRWSYLNFVGEIPKGKELDHKCKTRCCVNPDHLEPVTHKENVLRGNCPAAVQKRRTHCSRGHELSEENIYRWGAHRMCKTCRRPEYADDRRKKRLERAAKGYKPTGRKPKIESNGP